MLRVYCPFCSQDLLQLSVQSKTACVFRPAELEHLREKQCEAGI